MSEWCQYDETWWNDNDEIDLQSGIGKFSKMKIPRFSFKISKLRTV